MLGLVIFSLISTQPLPAPDGEPRVETIQAPVILWEEGPPISWTRGRDDERSRVASALMAPLLPPDMAAGESLIASIDVGARLVLMSNSFEFNVFSGPQSIRFAPQGVSGVIISRVAVPEGLGPAHAEPQTLSGSPRWAAGTFSLRLLQESPALSAAPGELRITWPNARALRLPTKKRGPVVAWRHSSAPDPAPCNIEVEELNAEGEATRVQERWTGIRTESLELQSPWAAGRRYRFTVADVKTRVSTETLVLGEEAAAEVDRSLAEVRALHGALGAAAIALEALVLHTAELDAEARIRWWHLAMAALADGQETRADELFARAGSSWP